MNLKQTSLIVAALVIMGGLGWYSLEHKRVPAPLAIRTETITQENAQPPYLINIEYPVIDGLRTKAAGTGVNDGIFKTVQDAISGFKDEIKDIIVYPDEPNQRSEFGMKYETELATSSLVSIRFNNYSYSAGAAHPNSYTQSFNYDLAGNREVALADLFRPNTDYLKVISDHAKQALTEKFKESGDWEALADWINAGTAPITENYQVFLITKNGLLIIFNPYQVGPYAIGAQEVSISYATLADIIASEGPLGIFLSSQ